MTSFRTIAIATLASAGALALCSPAALAAQAMIQSLEPNDADRLAAQMRALAANPQDLTALATAGELSLKLGDLSGAAALFARADKVDPRNGRIKAGMGAVLVRSERPGEALRFFDQAASYGWTVDRFAADRGLAYDLIGQNDRAQRDYRLALLGGRDDETVRRYALSLGIAGKREQALEQLDPLVRRQDRASWRAQAFVLAMGGDTAGAAKIATAIMPAAMNQGLGAFFQRLPTLSPTDRAFAVHFGEIYATPERVADARLTPALAALLPEPVTAVPVQVAATTAPVSRRERRKRDRDRAAPVAAVVQVAQAPQPAPAVPPVVRMGPPREVVQALPGRAPLPVTTNPRVALAGATAAIPAPTRVAAISGPIVAPAPQAMREPDVRVAGGSAIAAPSPSVAVARPVAPAAVTTIAATQPAAAQPAAAQPAATQPAFAATELPGVAPTVGTPALAAAGRVITVPVTTGPATTVPVTTGPLSVATTGSSSPPVRTVAASSAAPTRVAAAPVAPIQSSTSTTRADAVLARIVANLSIPAAELGIDPVRPDPAPISVPAAVAHGGTSSAGRRVVAEASAKEARDGAVRRVVAARLTGDAEADEPTPVRGRTRAGRRGVAVPVEVAAEDMPARGRSSRRGGQSSADEAIDEPVSTSRKGRVVAAADDRADGRADAAPKARSRSGTRAVDADEPPLDPKAKRAADRKALADKKAAADKKALAEQAAADRKAARANPPRIWVQVAGGANEDDLGKAWGGVKARAPALAGRSGYATPLRATNRVLTGPFKTDAEARAFVNQLKKQGVSGFSFTSDAGQEVTKLSGK